MYLLADGLSTGSMVFLVLAIGLALSFEFVNGFHDTANAVATVIYTHTLPPWIAVIWSGCWNLAGVLVSTGAVAFTILALLPVELILNVGSGAGFAMVFALLISAIIWNIGTWYLGLPASSSHTLIGSIMGVGVANALMKGHAFSEGVNWSEVHKVFASLLISPLVGFVLAGGMLLISKALIKSPALYKAPPKDAPPPPWIRGLLVLTCTGVSFFHGSNDGQKGMGLMLLILIGILPAIYAVNPTTDTQKLHDLQSTALVAEKSAGSHGGAPVDAKAAPDELSAYLKTTGQFTNHVFPALATMNQSIIDLIGTKRSLADFSTDQRKELRTDIYLASETIGKLGKQKQIKDAELKMFGDYKSNQLDPSIKFIPTWVKVAVAMALGLGTMIGWKRIVTTVGEKIGKDHLTYAQGASAEIVAMVTIGFADWFGMPVSTTHVLSSGVAGTMAANHSGLQMGTLRNLLLAWVLTLPVCVILGAGTFAAGLFLIFNHLAAVIAAVASVAATVLLALKIRAKVRAEKQNPVREEIAV